MPENRAQMRERERERERERGKWRGIISLLSKHKKYYLTFLYILLISCLFLLDDCIFRIFRPISDILKSEIRGRDTRASFIILIGIASFITFNKKQIYNYIIIGFFAILSFIQLNYLAYYGSTIPPSVLPRVFVEIPEITTSGFGEFHRVYFAFLSSAISYLTLLIVVKFLNKNFIKMKYSFCFLLVITIPIVRVLTNPTIGKMLAKEELSTFYNGLNITSVYLFKLLPMQFIPNTTYKAYIVTQDKSLKKEGFNIVINFGESFNYYNQGIFGYELNTTPFLNSIKNDKNFAYKKGLSNAFNTISSLVVFFNLQREADNFSCSVKQETNLFRLAKESGFKTILISAQNKYNMRYTGLKYVDLFIAQEDEQELFDAEKDEALLILLKKHVDINKGNNFIVLHQRNVHSPYKTQWENKKEKFAKFEKDYDNGIFMNDTIYKDTITYLKTSTKPFYYFITSDHGEMTGQDGLYGHIEGNLKTVEIPIFLYTNDKDKSILNELKNNFMPTNYEVGLLISKLMGYKIENPNTPSNVYHISADWDKRSFYYEIIKHYDTKTVEYNRKEHK